MNAEETTRFDYHPNPKEYVADFDFHRNPKEWAARFHYISSLRKKFWKTVIELEEMAQKNLISAMYVIYILEECEAMVAKGITDDEYFGEFLDLVAVVQVGALKDKSKANNYVLMTKSIAYKFLVIHKQRQLYYAFKKARKLKPNSKAYSNNQKIIELFTNDVNYENDLELLAKGSTEGQYLRYDRELKYYENRKLAEEQYRIEEVKMNAARNAIKAVFNQLA